MAFRVQDFRSQMVSDGARPNLFRCTLNFPVLATSSSTPTGFASGAGEDEGATETGSSGMMNLFGLGSRGRDS